jgi:hypothetical protein
MDEAEATPQMGRSWCKRFLQKDELTSFFGRKPAGESFAEHRAIHIDMLKSTESYQVRELEFSLSWCG